MDTRGSQSALLSDLRNLIQSARQQIASAAPSTQTLHCWHLRRRRLNQNLRGSRAEYGGQTLVTVSRELAAECGRGLSYPELTRMVLFAQLFTEPDIVATLSQQLSWPHVHSLLPIKEPLARGFYAEMCRVERWDTRLHRSIEHARWIAARRLPAGEDQP